MPGDRAAGRLVMGRPLSVSLIFAEKAVSSVAVGAGSVLALVLHSRGNTDPLSILIPGELRETPRDSIVRWLVSHVPHPAPSLTLWIGIGLIFWCLLLAAEAIGIWYDLVWGECLIILETASFLPFEIWDIHHHPHTTGFISLGLNLLICAIVVEFLRRRLRSRAAGVTVPRWGPRHLAAVRQAAAADDDDPGRERLRASES